MSIKREEVQRIAALAKLELSQDEIDRYALQLTHILDYIEQLRELPDETAAASPSDLQPTPLRPDEVTHPAESALGLQQAPDREGDFFRVPRILE